MLKALNRKAIALAATLQSMYLKAASEERGDTNFISILIILGIVILACSSGSRTRLSARYRRLSVGLPFADVSEKGP